MSESLLSKVTFEQRPERSMGERCAGIWGENILGRMIIRIIGIADLKDDP